jgi:hypothetical protein
MIDLRRMAFCRVREVNFLHGILHGISAVTDEGSSRKPDNELLADKTKEAAAANRSVRHGTCFHRRLSTRHAGAAPHSAVAELGVVFASEAGATRVQVPPLAIRLFTSASW